MVKKLKDLISRSRRIVFLGGAGVSTESGIPDFRSGNSAAQAQKKYGHPPEVLLSHSFFIEQPEIFFDYYINNLIHVGASPNNAHKSLSMLENRGKLSSIVTQNIDGLHQMAGSRHVLELHGSVHRNYCVDCGARYDSVQYITDSPGRTPVCKKCGGLVRPDVVLYEEGLSRETLSQAESEIRKADTLIVGGTSLVVWPAAGLLQFFSGENLVLINKSATGFDSQASLVIHKPIGEVLGQAVLDT